jgi:hypothetical protein
MIGDGMKGGAHSQTRSGSHEEAAHGEHITHSCPFIPWFEDPVQNSTQRQSQGPRDEMRPNIDTLVMPVKYTLQRPAVAVRRLSIAGMYVHIVLAPMREIVPVNQGVPQIRIIAGRTGISGLFGGRKRLLFGFRHIEINKLNAVQDARSR